MENKILTRQRFNVIVDDSLNGSLSDERAVELLEHDAAQRTEIERLQAESRTALSISATLADTGERLMQLAGEEFRADYARGILKTFRSAVVAIRELKHKETTNA